MSEQMGYFIPNACIDDKSDPCYFRLPDNKCGRQKDDGPCIHAERIAKRHAESKALQKGFTNER